MTEHRQHPRYAIELDAVVHFGQGELFGRTENVSRGGFCMFADAALPVGDSCDVKLALVFSEDQHSEQLHLPATIVWCTPVGGRFQIGFKFTSLSPQNDEYLSLFMQYLEGDGESDEDEEAS